MQVYSMQNVIFLLNRAIWKYLFPHEIGMLWSFYQFLQIKTLQHTQLAITVFEGNKRYI